MKKLVIIVMFMVYIIPCSAENHDAQKPADAMDLHLKGFEHVLSQAEADNFYTYGLYSSRILAVQHPEVYLQADMLFAQYITSIPGFGVAYTEPVTSHYFDSDNYYKMAIDDPFSFDQVDVSAYTILSKEDIYGENRPVFPFLDERLTSMKTTLKTTTMTSLEGASLLYVQRRMKGSPRDETFVIFTKRHEGYLYAQGEYYTCVGEPIHSEDIVDPILIFNEQVSWYPLMHRDDSAQSDTLRALVIRLSSDDVFPEMTARETHFAERLQTVSQLTTADQRDWAIVSSLQYADYRINDTALIRLFERIKLTTSLQYNRHICGSIMKIGNYLSPHTAFFGSLIQHDALEHSLQRLSEAYLERTATIKEYPNRTEDSAWGHTWPCGLIENDIDDVMRTQGGHCVSQAINLSAVLDLTEVDNVVIYLTINLGAVPWGHDITIIPTLQSAFDNARFIQGTMYKKPFRTGVALHGDALFLYMGADLYSNADDPEELHQYVQNVIADFRKGSTLYHEYDNSQESNTYKTLLLP